MKRYKPSDYISHKSIYGVPIVGYDSLFWDHCLETDRYAISRYPKNDQLHTLSFKCDNGHPFCRTPYDFFNSRYYCPICITKDDIGAVNCDPEIAEYYVDNRYPITEISEHCDVDLQFKCPDCNIIFLSKMTTMIKNPKKCPFCKVPRQEDQCNSSNDSFTYISLQ